MNLPTSFFQSLEQLKQLLMVCRICPLWCLVLLNKGYYLIVSQIWFISTNCRKQIHEIIWEIQVLDKKNIKDWWFDWLSNLVLVICSFSDYSLFSDDNCSSLHLCKRVTMRRNAVFFRVFTLHHIDLARNGNSGCANEILGCAKCHFWWKSPGKLKN